MTKKKQPNEKKKLSISLVLNSILKCLNREKQWRARKSSVVCEYREDRVHESTFSFDGWNVNNNCKSCMPPKNCYSNLVFGWILAVCRLELRVSSVARASSETTKAYGYERASFIESSTLKFNNKIFENRVVFLCRQSEWQRMRIIGTTRLNTTTASNGNQNRKPHTNNVCEAHFRPPNHSDCRATLFQRCV